MGTPTPPEMPGSPHDFPSDLPPPPAPSLRQVNYWAVSIFTSRTFFLMAASLSEVTTLIPPRFVPLWSMVVALVNLYLRTATVRPVAFIKPGETQAVLVPRVGPPVPAKLGD